MPKLQKITRTNGSEVYSVNIPLEDIENIGWKKGDEIETKQDKEKITLTKKEVHEVLENGENI